MAQSEQEILALKEIQKPILTPELFERNRKFENIFIPCALRLRDKVFTSRQNSFARFVHYTSAEAALKIITQKRLWMRNTSCMVDYREVEHGFNVLHKFFCDKAKFDSFTSVLNNIAAGAADEAIGNFNKWWQMGLIKFQTFIASVSEHLEQEDIHGRLSMWRAAGGNTPRVAIVFKVPSKSDAPMVLNLQFSPVAYLTDQEAGLLVPEVIQNVIQNELFLKTAERQEIVNWIFHMLLWGVICIKHEGFHEEREWRVVHCPLIFQSSLITGSTEMVGGMPQFIYKLPLDRTVAPRLDDLDISQIFDRLIIGPTPYPAVMFDAFLRVLREAGIADADKKIFVSHIPIR